MNWEPLLMQGRESFADLERFDEDERHYKLAIAAAVQKMLESAGGGGDWPELVASVFNRSHGGHRYNLSRYSQHDWLREIDTDTVESARQMCAYFLEEDEPTARFERFAGFAEANADQQGKARGAVLVVGSVLNFGVDPSSLPPLKTRALTSAEEIVGWDPPEGSATNVYAGHLGFVQAFEEVLRKDGLPVRDTLDAQSVIWEWWNDHQSLAGKAGRIPFSEDESIVNGG